MQINQINIPLPNLVSEVLTDGDFGAEDISTSGSLTLTGLNVAGFVTNTAGGVLGTQALIGLTSDIEGILPVANGGTNRRMGRITIEDRIKRAPLFSRMFLNNAGKSR